MSDATHQCGAICNGILKTKRRIVRCPKCKRRRLHRVHERYDSFLWVCATCGLERFSGI